MIRQTKWFLPKPTSKAPYSEYNIHFVGVDKPRQNSKPCKTHWDLGLGVGAKCHPSGGARLAPIPGLRLSTEEEREPPSTYRSSSSSSGRGDPARRRRATGSPWGAAERTMGRWAPGTRTGRSEERRVRNCELSIELDSCLRHTTPSVHIKFWFLVKHF
jgi:hypothetical protein